MARILDWVREEMNQAAPVAPQWGRRIEKWKIARIYEDDAQGLHDEDLLNDVAYTLFERCKSMLSVDAARNGRADCPVCDAVVEHAAQKGASMVCGGCGWTGSWDAYHRSFDRQHLVAPGLLPFCREYVQRLPEADTPRKKMYWIDWLIHRFHWEGTALPGQPGATSLIQGRAQDVNTFLEALTAGTHQPQNDDSLDQLWSTAQKEQIARWREASERRRARKRT